MMTTKDEETFICDDCGETDLTEDEVTNVDDEFICESCLSDNYFSCDSCGEYFKNEEKHYIEGDVVCESCYDNNANHCSSCGECFYEVHYCEQDDEYYCDSCYPEENCNDDASKEMGAEIKGTTFKMNKHKRRFGVEIEAEKGEGSTLESSFYEHNFPWALTTDGSLDCSGVEAVSPPMSGDEAYRSIGVACKLMSEAGFEPTTSAGVHVHFDFNSDTKTTEEDIKKIVACYYHYEDFFYRMLPKSRSTTSYCASLKTKYKNLPSCLYGNLDNIYRHKGCKSDKYAGERYSNLNIHSWFFRGTLEVRTHSATLNPEKIINWIEIHQKFFDYALSKPLSFWLKTKPNVKIWYKILGRKLSKYYNDRVKEIQQRKRISNKDINKKVKEAKRFKSLIADNTDLELSKILRGSQNV